MIQSRKLTVISAGRLPPLVGWRSSDISGPAELAADISSQFTVLASALAYLSTVNCQL